MPFAPNASVVSTDLDNMLRGLYRDNSDHAFTGSVVETVLATVSISANTIGPTGGLFMLASGTSTGAGGTKSVIIRWGSVILYQLTPITAGNQQWFIKLWMYNTATNSQRVWIEGGWLAGAAGTPGAPTLSYTYATALQDTTANQVLKTSVVLGSAGDTLTNSLFDIYVAQIN